MDKFKCEKCGKIFDEDEANYNFMASVGKELCDKCIETFSIEDEKLKK